MSLLAFPGADRRLGSEASSIAAGVLETIEGAPT